MKLFISWSGERSKLLAEGLRKWLPGVINAVEPWLSSNDIDPGARWGPELASQLENTRYGIICATSDNLNAPWLLFEAGALSKYVDKSRVVPLILDLKPAEIKGPLAQFQAVQTTESDIKKLIIAINQTVFDSGEKGMDKAFVDEAYKLWWPQLKKSIDDIPKVIEDVRHSERSEKEMIEEILVLVRANLQQPLVRQSSISVIDNEEMERLLIIYDSLPHAMREDISKSLAENYSFFKEALKDRILRKASEEKGPS